MLKWSEIRIRPQVIQGMTLGTLLKVLARYDFQVDRECLGRLAHLLGLGVFNSVLAACETIFNSRDINSVEITQPPLFVIGHWRSGTTHLHNLLSLDDNFTYPTAYQASFPHHFIFSQVGGMIFNFIAPTKRPMDNVAFSSFVPHEDEFGLAAYSAISPYIRILFPVTGDDGYTELDPERLPKHALEEWKQSMRVFLKKMALSEPGRVVLKSPPHLGRVKTLLEMFPDAQFIHIVRDPYTVFSSSRKLWKNSLWYAHLQVPDQDQVDEIILSWYTKLFEIYQRDRTDLPDCCLYEMKFEDLESRPLEILEEAYKKLNLKDFDVFAAKVRGYLAGLDGYRKNTHNLSEDDKQKVRARWFETFRTYGYPS